VKLAFIVQRYGAEILGGSEYHCRLIAERLAAKHDVDVLTTCARDYITWENEYPEGTDRIRGVTVRRFKNARTRDITSFNQYSDWIFHHPHTRDDEMSWLEQQGPWCPALLDYLNKNHRHYDALIFFTYLYAPTVLGLDIDPSRSILVPTAHNEPAIHLSIYRDMFARAVAEETVGCGVDLMQDQSQPDEPEPEDEEEQHKRLPAHLRVRGAQFRRRHRLQGQFLLYGGRIDAGKGCEELIEYFTSYKEQGGDAQLALMGVKLMQLPEVPWVRFAGLLSERERLQALEAATVVVVPSPFESLSLLALEAMAVGTPVLCNARAEVLVEHCLKSNAGLFYSDRDEFVECAKLMLADDRLRDRMGRNGKEYIKRNYRWDVILSKYDRLIGALKR
jgi:glycosyltransferase involved in cell wall biosynthesis